jgi:hypothetical protein
MDRSANVTSIDAIRMLRVALHKFEANSRDAVTHLLLEVRKAVDWLENDRSRYWPEQVRKAGQWVTQARNDLERCQLAYGSEEAPSCYEQKKALERAKRRLRLCEEKVKAVRHWRRTIRGEMDEFDGQMARLNSCLDADLPRAIAALDRMLQALEKYAQASPAREGALNTPATTDSSDSDLEENPRPSQGDAP